VSAAQRSLLNKDNPGVLDKKNRENIKFVEVDIAFQPMEAPQPNYEKKQKYQSASSSSGVDSWSNYASLTTCQLSNGFLRRKVGSRSKAVEMYIV